MDGVAEIDVNDISVNCDQLEASVCEQRSDITHLNDMIASL